MKGNTGAIITALFIVEIAVTFESAMVYAALPTLIGEFGDPLKAGWLVTSHMLIGAATVPVAGRFGDIIGRKQVILVLLMFVLVGSLISAMSSNYGLVLLGRALQGISAAALPLAIGVVREALTPLKVPMAIGVLTTAQGAGTAAGLVLGGLIVDHFNWHWLFWVSALLAAIGIAAVIAFVPSKPGTPTREPIDWVEGLLPVPGIAALLFAISSSSTFGWRSPQVLGLLAFGLMVMVWWGRKSLRASEPFIDLRLFANRNFAAVNGIAILIGMGTLQIVYVFSAYSQSPAWTMVGLGLTATVFGLIKLPSNFLSFFAGPLTGWLTLRTGDRTSMVAGALLATSGWFFAMTLPPTVFLTVAALCVISFGTTMMFAAIPNVIVGAVPQNRTSEALGSMSVVRGLAGAIGAQVIALLLASSTLVSPENGAHYPDAAAYRITMAVMAVLTLAAVFVAMTIRPRRIADDPQPG